MGRHGIPRLRDEFREYRDPEELVRPRHAYYRNRAKLVTQLKLLNRFALREGWTKRKLLEQSLAVQRMFQADAMERAANRFKMNQTSKQRRLCQETLTAINDRFSSQKTQQAVEEKFDSIEEAKSRQGIKEDKRKPGRIIIP